MKKIIFSLLIFPSLTQVYSQVTNIRAGSWSESTVWSSNSLPTTNDSVTLFYDIIVDVYAICRSLNSNGHNVTINPNINLLISGGALSNPSLLTQLVILDTTQIAPRDTQFIYTYFYDELNRCSRIKVNDFQSSKIGYTYNFYNGSDRVINSRKLINQVYWDSLFEYFRYSADDKMISDSIVEFGGASHILFTYNYISNEDSIQSFITANGSPLLLAKYLITKDNYDNVILEKDTSFQYGSGAYTYQSNSNISYSYDSNPCPFFNLYPKRLVGLNYEMFAVDDIPFYMFLQKNNVTSKIQNTLPVWSGIGNSKWTFDYFYNSTGYPQSVIFRDFLDGSVLKGIFSYR